MARYYLRGDKGRFAGSTGGGGGFVGGRRQRSSNSQVVRVRGGSARVSRVRNGQLVRPSKWTAHAASGGTVGRIVRTRPGARVDGNGNVRYMSRGHRRTRAVKALVGGPLSIPGPAVWAGRAHSRAVINRGAAPRSGYIITYGPRG